PPRTPAPHTPAPRTPARSFAKTAPSRAPGGAVLAKLRPARPRPPQGGQGGSCGGPRLQSRHEQGEDASPTRPDEEEEPHLGRGRLPADLVAQLRDVSVVRLGGQVEHGLEVAWRRVRAQ